MITNELSEGLKELCINKNASVNSCLWELSNILSLIQHECEHNPEVNKLVRDAREELTSAGDYHQQGYHAMCALYELMKAC